MGKYVLPSEKPTWLRIPRRPLTLSSGVEDLPPATSKTSQRVHLLVPLSSPLPISR